MSGHKGQSTAASDLNEAEQDDEFSTAFSPELIKGKVKANLEPLQAQIFALTQTMDKLTQAISVREYPMASTREPRFPSKCSFTAGPGISRTLPLAHNRGILARQQHCLYW